MKILDESFKKRIKINLQMLFYRVLEFFRENKLMIVFVLLIVLLLLNIYLMSVIGFKRAFSLFLVEPPKPLPVNNSTSGSGIFKGGDIGEKADSEKFSNLPLLIFTVNGPIKEVGLWYIVIEAGSNFADQKIRDIKVIFTERTITMKIGGKEKYPALEGLKLLKPGMQVLIQAEENIRGKVEFNADYVFII